MLMTVLLPAELLLEPEDEEDSEVRELDELPLDDELLPPLLDEELDEADELPLSVFSPFFPPQALKTSITSNIVTILLYCITNIFHFPLFFKNYIGNFAIISSTIDKSSFIIGLLI